MPAPKDVDLYDNPFGHELRRHRLRLELTQAPLGKRLGYSEDTISKIETGVDIPSIDFARDCDTLFKTHGAMETLARLVRRRSGLPRWAREWFDAEQEAHRLRYWEALIVPGLLQTPDYARELLRTHPGMTQERVEELVAARMERKKVLDRDDPPTLWLMMDEGVLRAQVGSTKVMDDQLRALIEALYHTHVNIQVVPVSAGRHIGCVGAFAIASFDGEPDVVYLESARAGRVSELPEDVRAITDIWEAIRMKALPDHASLDLISKVMEQWT